MLTPCPQSGFWNSERKVQHFCKFAHFHYWYNHMIKCRPFNFQCLHSYEIIAWHNSSTWLFHSMSSESILFAEQLVLFPNLPDLRSTGTTTKRDDGNMCILENSRTSGSKFVLRWSHLSSSSNKSVLQFVMKRTVTVSNQGDKCYYNQIHTKGFCEKEIHWFNWKHN